MNNLQQQYHEAQFKPSFAILRLICFYVLTVLVCTLVSTTILFISINLGRFVFNILGHTDTESSVLIAAVYDFVFGFSILLLLPKIYFALARCFRYLKRSFVGAGASKGIIKCMNVFIMLMSFLLGPMFTGSLLYEVCSVCVSNLTLVDF